MEILVSIITVNYNNYPGLKKTVESVIRQSSKDFEFIVIDGNSTDGSKELITQYQEHLAYSVSEPDNGIYHAMNKGIEVAKGNYLLFLNSGDSLSNHATLETVRPYLTANYGIVYGNAAYVEGNERVVRTYPSELSFQFFWEHNLSHQASFIRRSLFKELFLYNENYQIASDWEFFVYAICKKDIPYLHIDQTICDYDTTGISSMLNNHKVMHEERTQTLRKHFPLFISDYEKFALYNATAGKRFAKIKDHPLAFKILKALMKLILFFLPKSR